MTDSPETPRTKAGRLLLDAMRDGKDERDARWFIPRIEREAVSTDALRMDDDHEPHPCCRHPRCCPHALAASDAGTATRSYIGRVRDTEERLIAESLRTDAGPAGIDVERLARAFDAHPGPARASDNIAHDRGHHGDECWQQIAAEYDRLSRESDR
jgi:hypothetical protein